MTILNQAIEAAFALMKSRQSTIATLTGLAVITLLFPQIALWTAILGATALSLHVVGKPGFSTSNGLIAFFSKLKSHSSAAAPNDPHGLVLGHDRVSSMPIRMGRQQATEHIAIIGSTADGKREQMLGMAHEAIAAGGGVIYVDGTGDVSQYAKLYASAVSAGREDDFLVLNFMTGNRDLSWTEGKFISNSLNPFGIGASDALTQMIVSLMDDVGDGGMWKGRAVAMISGVMRALTYLRDQNVVDLNVGTIRDYLNLKRIIDLTNLKKNPDLPAHIRKSLQSYLTSLPGYVEEKDYKQAQTTLDQHGYLEMQFTRIMGSLADVYGHIFLDNENDIDMRDVIKNKRILIVLLPCLEKVSEDCGKLASIVISCARNAIALQVGPNQQKTLQQTTPFYLFLEGVSNPMKGFSNGARIPNLAIIAAYSHEAAARGRESDTFLAQVGTRMTFHGSGVASLQRHGSSSQPLSSLFPSIPKVDLSGHSLEIGLAFPAPASSITPAKI
ncbi:hypothetical protein [Bosea sp. RAC05]|uniref:hypothetical protein n=1 Tax=Bosea sp. RAC05 TaxID=1842539 RepID=UPI00083DC970|nr:hypothetical protein [Bosea sp. RAC05]AOG03241.1 hypothetical protein BSY19_5429 [Bosea sp. RAC05]